MQINGYWFEPNSSTRRPAILYLTGELYDLHVAGTALRHGPGNELRVSDRLGNVARRVSWPDEGVFETTDNASVDEWLNLTSHQGVQTLGIHRLEQSWRWAALGALVTVAVVYGCFKWGIPLLATQVAQALPVSVHESISRGALQTMDRFFFNPSVTSEAEQMKIQQRFAALVESMPGHEFSLKLHFRHMGGVPNAMALPGGDIVITDALVKFVERPEELDSVILHEIGHVLERHGMQHVIQASAVSLIAALALGDVSGIGELAAGVPVFLLQSSYSRSSESEADEFAFSQMSRLGIDPRHFATIITRLSKPGIAPDDGGVRDGDRNQDGGLPSPSGDPPKKEVSDYFSTHPDSGRRSRRALEVSREMGF